MINSSGRDLTLIREGELVLYMQTEPAAKEGKSQIPMLIY